MKEKNMSGRRFGKAVSVLFPLGLLLTGCFASPPPLPVLPLAPTQSRLIFFRPVPFLSNQEIPLIKVNGASTCGLKDGSAFAQDVAPGIVKIDVAAAPGLFFGAVSGSFTAVAGQTYYIEFKRNLGAILIPGALIESAIGAQTGYFNVFLSDASQMGNLKPVGCNPGT